MNALAYWNQFKELEALHNSLGSLFGRPQAHRPEGREKPMRVAEWTPQVDISEDGKEYMIMAELPEMKKEAVKIKPRRTDARAYEEALTTQTANKNENRKNENANNVTAKQKAHPPSDSVRLPVSDNTASVVGRRL